MLYFGHMRPSEFITLKQRKALYLALSFMAGVLMEFKNSSHLICRIPSAKVINRGAKNMTLILLTRTTETLKTCAHVRARAHGTHSGSN